MNKNDISYALAKQVPDMAARGFVIGTAYGELTIDPGWMAERIAQHVRRVLECEQIAQPDTVLPVRIEQGLDAAAKWLDDRATGKVTPDGYDTHGFKPGAGVIGAGYVPRPAAAPCHAGSAARSAAGAIQPPHAQAPHPATNQTHGGHQ